MQRVREEKDRGCHVLGCCHVASKSLHINQVWRVVNGGLPRTHDTALPDLPQLEILMELCQAHHLLYYNFREYSPMQYPPLSSTRPKHSSITPR